VEKAVSRETSGGSASAAGKRDSAKQPHALENRRCFSMM
jgi:hypothetical protein